MPFYLISLADLFYSMFIIFFFFFLLLPPHHVAVTIYTCYVNRKIPCLDRLNIFLSTYFATLETFQHFHLHKGRVRDKNQLYMRVTRAFIILGACTRNIYRNKKIDNQREIVTRYIKYINIFCAYYNRRAR